jgi:hypothetical protein
MLSTDADVLVWHETMKYLKYFIQFSAFDTQDERVLQAICPAGILIYLAPYMKGGIDNPLPHEDQIALLSSFSQNLLAKLEKLKAYSASTLPVELLTGYDWNQDIEDQILSHNTTDSSFLNHSSNTNSNGNPPLMDQMRSETKRVKESLRALATLLGEPSLSAGAQEFLKQEIKQIKTILRETEELLENRVNQTKYNR